MRVEAVNFEREVLVIRVRVDCLSFQRWSRGRPDVDYQALSRIPSRCSPSQLSLVFNHSTAHSANAVEPGNPSVVATIGTAPDIVSVI